VGLVGVEVIYVTDPACPRSWAAEPLVRRIEAEFGAQVHFTYRMAGLARTVDDAVQLARELLDAGAASGMPVDARGWLAEAPRSTFPACLAVVAAREQGHDAALLRALREGFLLRRRRPDTRDALLAAARELPGLDATAFGHALDSSATVEAFGTDLEWARERGAGSHAFWVAGERAEPAALRPALLAAGAQAATTARPGVEEALAAHGALAAAEVAALCDLAPLRAAGELWRLALELRARPERLGSGELWHAG